MTWEEIPKGMCLMRMFHEGFGKHILHLHVKANDGDWFEQPRVPCYSQDVSEGEFWIWAEANLPIYEHPTPVKSGRK